MARRQAIVCLALAAAVFLSGCGRRTGPTSLGDFELTEGQVRAIEGVAVRLQRKMPEIGSVPIWEVWAVERYRNTAVAMVIHHFAFSIIWVTREPWGYATSAASGSFGPLPPGPHDRPTRPSPPSRQGSWRYSVQGQSGEEISPEERLHLVYGFLWCPAIVAVEVAYDDGHTSGRVPVDTKGYLILRRHRRGERVSVEKVHFYDRTGRRIGSSVPGRGPVPLHERTIR